MTKEMSRGEEYHIMRIGLIKIETGSKCKGNFLGRMSLIETILGTEVGHALYMRRDIGNRTWDMMTTVGIEPRERTISRATYVCSAMSLGGDCRSRFD